MKNAFLLILALLTWTSRPTEARNCVCLAKSESKTYQSFSTHFWGSKRAWSCAYDCLTPHGAQEIVGFHQEWYLGKDDGREGVCDGVSFINRYNNYVMDFIWIPQEPQRFDPLTDASAKNMQEWARDICQ